MSIHEGMTQDNGRLDFFLLLVKVIERNKNKDLADDGT